MGGGEKCWLVNHDINPTVELPDVKRFKKEVAEYLKMPITFANIGGAVGNNIPDQFDVVMKAKAFKVGKGTELCTSRLKTEPFTKFLSNNFPDKDAIIYYGFDRNEGSRIQRRVGILASMGFRSAYPLAHWTEDERTINSTMQVGIKPPAQYEQFKHANCVGCLKAGRQHWYIVYCIRPDLYRKGMEAENYIGYTIDRDYSLEELAPMFEKMKQSGVPQTEHIAHQKFWADVRKSGIHLTQDGDGKPCECIF